MNESFSAIKIKPKKEKIRKLNNLILENLHGSYELSSSSSLGRKINLYSTLSISGTE